MRRKFSAIGATIALGLALAIFGLRHRDAGEELDAAIQTLRFRPVEGRLSGLPYAPPPSKRRGSDEETPNIKSIAGRAMESNTRSDAAAVLAGHSSIALHRLEQITSGGSATAKDWSDYAALLLASDDADDPLRPLTALAATEHALDLDPSSLEAQFNRAVVLEALSLRAAAEKAYQRYLAVDPHSRWADEARERASVLQEQVRNAEKDKVNQSVLGVAARQGNELTIIDAAIADPSGARAVAELVFLKQWAYLVLHGYPDAKSLLDLCRIVGRVIEEKKGDSFLADTVRAIDAAPDPRPLAKAHLLFRDALFNPSGHPDIEKLRKAERVFAAHHSPMSLVAQFRIVAPWGFYFPRDSDALERIVPAKYRLLTADLQLARAMSALRDGLFEEARENHRKAYETFSAFGDEVRAVSVRERLALLLVQQGDIPGAWRLHRECFARTADAGHDSQSLAIADAATEALFERRWDIGHALLNAYFDALPDYFRFDEDEWKLCRIAAAHRAGLNRSARAHLAEMRKASVKRGSLRKAELQAVEAWMDDRLVSTESLLSLRESEILASALPQFFVERARTLQHQRQMQFAERELEQAVDILEHRDKQRPTDPMIEEAFLGDPSEAYFLLAAARDVRGDSMGALETLEQLRARLSESPVAPLPSDLHREIPAGTVLFSYDVLDDEVLIHAIDHDGIHRTSVPVSAEHRKRLIAALGKGSRIAGRALHRILIAPVADVVARAKTIVIVRDPALEQIPFAALLQDNGRYLALDHASVITPSIAWYLKALHRRVSMSRALLAVGNPALDERFNSLPGLTAAENEAETIAAMYPSRAMLLGANATKERVIGALAYCDAAHFAVHAVAAGGGVPSSFLRLTSSRGDDGKLFASDIAALKLSGVRTVVLAACRTAVASPDLRYSQSLTDAFLKAGAGSVVGSLWEIEDAPTRDLSIAFHRALRDGLTPAEALRAAQIEMIAKSSNNSTLAWASLQVYGSGL